MAKTLDERLDAAITRRDKLDASAKRVEGKKEAAEKSLQNVEAEIRAKGLDPDTLDESIEKLEAALEADVTQFEADVSAAETNLSPYLKEQS